MAKKTQKNLQDIGELAREADIQVEEKSVPVVGSKKGKKYIAARNKIQTALGTKSTKQATMALNEAIALLKKNAYAKFTETVEMHINAVEMGLKGEVLLPHATGKKTRVAVVDEELLKKLEAGVIDFDILVTTPAMMPKLTKFAKLLGPRGIMPNPKSGTIGANTDEMVQKFSGNTIRYKTEPKAPIIHLIIGKMSNEETELVDNAEAILTAMGKKNIKSVFLASTMSPSVQIKI